MVQPESERPVLRFRSGVEFHTRRRITPFSYRISHVPDSDNTFSRVARHSLIDLFFVASTVMQFRGKKRNRVLLKNLPKSSPRFLIQFFKLIDRWLASLRNRPRCRSPTGEQTVSLMHKRFFFFSDYGRARCADLDFVGTHMARYHIGCQAQRYLRFAGRQPRAPRTEKPLFRSIINWFAYCLIMWKYIRGNCDRCQIRFVDYDVAERRKYLTNVFLFARSFGLRAESSCRRTRSDVSREICS
ncbi:hypothetical protein PUN28_015648 [Cardiocondyla obscurior]|uniref:Uncharacterized protein n=1 Tax=Cardiocondyla obscurior TaxID=286306 RepID=A0AAW2EU45_9HYME